MKRSRLEPEESVPATTKSPFGWTATPRTPPSSSEPASAKPWFKYPSPPEVNIAGPKPLSRLPSSFNRSTAPTVSMSP